MEKQDLKNLLENIYHLLLKESAGDGDFPVNDDGGQGSWGLIPNGEHNYNPYDTTSRPPPPLQPNGKPYPLYFPVGTGNQGINPWTRTKTGRLGYHAPNPNYVPDPSGGPRKPNNPVMLHWWWNPNSNPPGWLSRGTGWNPYQGRYGGTHQ